MVGMKRGRQTAAGVGAGLFLLGAVSLAASPLFFQSFAAPNLLAYYPLDELAVGTADDAVGANDGTHLDAPTPNPADKAPLLFTNAASLGFVAAASASTGDRIRLPSTLLSGKTNLSVAWWMKTSNAAAQAIVSGATAAQNNSFVIYFENSTTYRHHENGVAANVTVPTIADNVWHHAAIVRDDGANTVTVYTDGIPRGTITALTFAGIAVDANGLIIGEEQDSVGGGFQSTQSFIGLLDDLRFYDRLLTAAEVAYLAAGNGPPPAPSLTSAIGGMNPGTGAAQVDLVWAAVTTTPATPVTYTVLRGTTLGGPYPTTVTSGATGTTFTDTNVTFGQTYFYVVQATNVGGTSANSNERSATPQIPPPRTNDHEEGFFEGGSCGCGSAVPGSPWALALSALALLLSFRRQLP